MRRHFTALLFFCASSVSYAQYDPSVFDASIFDRTISVSRAPEKEDNSSIDLAMFETDSLGDYYFPESEYEFIPGEVDFDVIKDRLSCIENEIPLHYNERVHAFVNYFAVKDREYTRMILKKEKPLLPFI
ncbi:hypothetical protein LVD15_04780 [Fulvivirga maritima]|uniref:hypothetical protein n=1 Tax=Fulvivirga maritima TaxID=2904247 RepID=UPI001F1DC980|nr:hypothetical protein [Fulvivirga maritima]UII27744.1 hypothetical protein LVD15_04780 [Fulvivirga maritima]